MAVFKTTNHKGDNFTRSPVPYAVGKRWAIAAYSDDVTLYDGHYMKKVGFADELPNGMEVYFRTKREANKAIKDAQALGILQS